MTTIADKRTSINSPDTRNRSVSSIISSSRESMSDSGIRSCDDSENENGTKTKTKKRMTLKTLKNRKSAKKELLQKWNKHNEDKLQTIDKQGYQDDPFMILFSTQETFELLNKFLKHEFNEENLEFVSAIYDYEELANQEERSEKAKQISATFIKLRSKKQVNLSEPQVQKIKEGMQKTELSSDLFFEAKKEALSMMKLNSFPRFSGQVSKQIHATWEYLIEEHSPEGLGEKYYVRLFKTAPGLKILFANNAPHAQYVMFISMITNCITVMDDLQQLIPKLADLSVRHRKYGCNTGQFLIFGNVLFEFLQDFLKEKWTSEAEEAWRSVFALISVVMKIFSGQVSKQIHATWEYLIEEHSPEGLGEKYYVRLFKTAPGLKILFANNAPHAQYVMFISMITNCITVMDDLQQLIPKLADLSVRHRKYGIY
eukprot:Pgem_evm1s5195